MSVPARPATRGEAIECPACEQAVRPAEVEPHLRHAHGFAPAEARRIARGMLENTPSPGQGEPGAGPLAPRPVSLVAPAPDRPSEGKSGRLANLASGRLGRTPRIGRPGKPHRADPAACETCAKLAPDKCHRHGGPTHSTSYRGLGMRGEFATKVRAYKKRLVEEALAAADGNRTHAARRLGVRTSYLFRLLHTLGIRTEDP